MNTIYNIIIIIASLLIIVILVLLIKIIFDIDQNVRKGKDIIENIKDITSNTKEEQEKIHSFIDNKIEKVNFVTKMKTAESIFSTLYKIIKKKN